MMSAKNNELFRLNDMLLEKSGTLSVNLEKSILHTLKDLTKDEIKELLLNVDSNLMLNRIFTSSFRLKEFVICNVIKEIMEERKGKQTI